MISSTRPIPFYRTLRPYVPCEVQAEEALVPISPLVPLAMGVDLGVPVSLDTPALEHLLPKLR